MTINIIEIATLLAAIVALFTALATAANNKGKASTDQFETVRQGYKSLCADLSAELVVLQARILLLEKELKASREENAQLRVEVNQLRHENEELRKQIAELEAFRIAATINK